MMYSIEKAIVDVRCAECDIVIKAGETYGRTDLEAHRHCRECTFRLGAQALRALIVDLRQQAKRIS